MKKKWVLSFISFALSAVVLAAIENNAIAQSYPNKPIRLVVPYIAGGATDILAREVAQKLKESLGPPVVIENKPGATAIIGTEIVSKSPPDGYTLVLATQASHAANVSLFSKLPYDPVKDFAPVTLLGTMANVLLVNLSIPANSVRELISLAKSKPGILNFASSGSGLAPHLAGELFKTMTGIDVVHVAYSGSIPAITAVINGEASFMFQILPTALPQIQANKIRALAVSSAKRSSILPDLPTVAESGLPGFDIVAWFGIMAPAGTPKEIITKLNTEIVKILQMPDVKERLLKLGIEPISSTPENFATYVREEIAKWGKLVKESGVQPQ